MSDTMTSWPPPDDQQSTTEKAKQEAKDVGHTAVSAGSDVASTAKEQGKQVARETARQAKNVYADARSHLRQQASSQQQRAAGGLRSVGDEIRSMAEQGGQSGPASEVARQASARISEVADWIEAREPGHVVTELKQFARRHPGVFLAGAGILGVLAGRLTRGLVADAQDSTSAVETGRTPTTPTTVTRPNPTAFTEPVAPGYPAVAATEPDGTVYAASNADLTAPPAVPPAVPAQSNTPDSGTRR